MGPEHPKVAYPLNNLAELYREQGKHEQAESLYQRAFAILEKALGQGHHELAYPLIGLASLYKEQGKYEQAEPLYQRGFAIREQQLGTDHPETEDTEGNLFSSCVRWDAMPRQQCSTRMENSRHDVSVVTLDWVDATK